MGFTGRPSAGCATCKQRRKRCDLTKPECGNCVSIGKHCPGPPDEIDILFRNKFVPQSQQVSSRGGQVGRWPSEDNPRAVGADGHKSKDDVVVDNTTRGAGSRLSGSRGHRMKAVQDMVPEISTDWTLVATTYFFNLHCQKDLPTRRLNPWLELQTDFFTTAKPDTALHDAVNALAIMTMSDELHIPEIANMGNAAYGEALRKVNKAISASDEALTNETAVSIFVLTSFELRLQDSKRLRRYQAHTEGLRKLLVLRGRKQLVEVESLKVFRALRVQVIYNYLLRGEALITTEEETIWTDESAYNATPIDDLSAVAARIPQLRVEVAKIRAGHVKWEDSTLSISARQVDQKLDQWLSKWQDHLSFTSTCMSERNESLWQQEVHIFIDLPHAVLMTHYCFLRIQVLDALRRGLQTQHPPNARVLEEQQSTARRIQALVDKVCFIVPFIAGQVREKGQSIPIKYDQKWIYPSLAEATWMLLPIVMVAQQETVSLTQKNWLRQKLVDLNADFGLVDACAMPRGTAENLSLSTGNW